MDDLDLNDDPAKLEAKGTSREIPAGWAVLFWGLILWGAYYLWANTPSLGGWSQAQDAEGRGAAVGSDVLATLLFTLIPALVAVGLWLGFARRRDILRKP
jgi:hypothetical protein